MPIKHLTEDQIRGWTVEQKDRWWLENVYQGDVPQMTWRVVISGFLLGGVLSLTNLYIAAKTSWMLGVGITAVILAFLIFQFLQKIGLGENYHVLENNILQSIATSAGYVAGPLIASMACYMVVTNEVIPQWKMMMWLLGLAVLGVFFAFPLKRRFINEEQLPFPEGRAAGVVMDTLHSEDGSKSVLPAKLLLVFGFVTAMIQLLQSSTIMTLIKAPFLKIPQYMDGWLYWLCARMGWPTPAIMGSPVQQLTIRPELDLAMIGAGGLMGIATGSSLLIGAIINYCILAPIMVHYGDIATTVADDGSMVIGFRAITTWSLWAGVAMMTTASLYSFFSKPQVFVSAFRGILGGKKRTKDCLRHIELPLWVAAIGVIFAGGYLVYLAHWFFGVEYWLGAVAVPLVFVFTLISVNATALTSIMPSGPLGKITQLTYGVLAPGNITTNIATAGIAAEVSGNASNLIQNIKPGYMLGGKPRLQAVGHLIGAVSGSLFSVLAFYPLFLKENPAGLQTADYPFPAVTVWKAVAELLTRGLSELPTTAIWGAAIGAGLGILLEIVRQVTKGKFPLSAVGIGLAFVIPFNTCFAMFLGAFVFWLFGKRWPKPEHRMNEILVQNSESICAGMIAGASLMGMGIMALETFVLA